MNENKNLKKGLGIHARRFIAYIVLILVTFACLFWFYVLFINATRSNGELQAGFTPLPSTHLLENWNNLVHGTLPVWQGMINSLIVSVLSAALCTYFSTMTAYAIHAYDFKLKKYIYAFILAVMMIPTQVTALGFVKLVGTLKMEDTFIPLIVPTIAAPVTFFYMKQYMESTLPVSLIEAARIDGSGEYSVSEAGDEKTVTMVELLEKGSEPHITELPLTPMRRVRKMIGHLDEILNAAAEDNCHDYVSITLTDEVEAYQPKEKLEQVYDHILEIKIDNERTRKILEFSEEEVESLDPYDAFVTFFQEMNGRAMTEDEDNVIRTVINGEKEVAE